MRIRRWMLSAATVGMSAALVAGCGSNSNASKATGGLSSGASISKRTILLGNVGSYSGALSATTSGQRTALEVWEKSVNASGGLDGHPIKILFEDDSDVASTAQLAAKKLVAEHVIAFIGVASGYDGPVGAYLKTQNIPVIGGISYDSGFAEDSNLFPVGSTLLATTYSGVAVAQKQGGRKVGLMYCAEAPVCAQLDPLFKGIAASVGVQYVYKSKVSGSATDYTAVCQAAKSAEVNELDMALTSPVELRVAAGCAQQGYKPLIAGNTGSITSDWLTNPAVNGVQFGSATFPWFSSAVPAAKDYRDALATYAPSFPGTAEDNLGGAFGWLSGKLFEAAMKNVTAADPTSADLFAALYSLKGETLGGLTPPLTFNKGKVTNVNCWFTVGIKDGKYTTPNGFKTDCIPAAAQTTLGVTN